MIHGSPSFPSSSHTPALAAHPDPSIVEIADLVKRYGDVVAVDHLSLTVQPGEVFGLLGPNGAGKTTILEVLVGLRKQDSGRATVLGLELPRQARQLSPRIGVQLQESALPRYLGAREVLELFAAFYPRHRAINEVLLRFGFETASQQRTPCRYLSAGQRSRLAVAAAMLHEPEVLFLDEPTAGLDPQARLTVWTVLAERKAAGQTTFLTTHDMHEAERVCDRVAIIDHGRLLALGRPRELAGQATSEHAIWVQTNGGPLPEAAERLPGVTRAVRQDEGLLLYSAEVPRTLAELLKLSADGLTFESIHIRPPSLEDLFLQLTGRRIRP